jgi:uncharacterized phage protein gp47/JayE
MPFDIPALADTRDLLVALGRALFPELNFTSTRSWHGKWATFLSGAVTQLHAHVDSAQRDLHPLTAGPGKPISDWGAALKVIQRGATPARKSAAGRVRGSAGSTVLPGTQMLNPQTGFVFAIANATTITIPGTVGISPDSFVDADIVSIDKGSGARLQAGVSLFFLSAPAGIEAEVVLQKALDEGGFDEEQYGSYRARVLDVLAATASGGSQGDFVRWAKESLASVATAYAYPNRAGRGTIDVVAFYAASGTSRSLSAGDRTIVRDYIASKAPFQVSGPGLRVITTIADPQNVDILIATNGVLAYQFDWTGSGLVSTWNPTTRELTWSSSLPSQLRAGHRIVLAGTNQDGREYKVEAISGASSVILEVAPPTAPAAGVVIWPGGPLVKPIRDAVLGHLNGETVYAGRGGVPVPESAGVSTANPGGVNLTGLDILADGVGPANPFSSQFYPNRFKYGPWIGSISRSVIAKIATYKTGVASATVVTPSDDYEPLDDAQPQAQIHYVVPNSVVVRGNQ